MAWSDWSEAVDFTTMDRNVLTKETTIVGAPYLAAGDRLGWSTAISKDGMYAVGCALYNDSRGTDSGAGSVYKFNGTSWSHVTSLYPVTLNANARFGYSCGISGDGKYVIVGAYGSDVRLTDAGAIYVFRRDDVSGTYSLTHTLWAADMIASDYLGWSCAISADGSRILGGCRGGGSSDIGYAYIWTNTNGDGSAWVQEAKLAPYDGAASDVFGSTCAINNDGSVLVIGAINDDDKGSNSGSAYVFKRTGTSWAFNKKLTASDGAANDLFSSAVDIDATGTRIIATSYIKSVGGVAGKGAAYIFVFNGTTYVQEAIITASDGTTNDYFGWSCAIDDLCEFVMIGCRNDDDGFTDAGSAYIYRRDSNNAYQFYKKLQGSNKKASDAFTYSLDLSGDAGRAIVGATNQDLVGTDSGAIYFYE